MTKSAIKVVYIKELVKLECKDSYLVNSEQRIENSFYEYVVILWEVFSECLNCFLKEKSR
jgi:hypothetical protein